MSQSPEPRPLNDLEMPPEVPAGPKINDIKHEFHPHSGRPLQEESLEDYLRTESLRRRPPPKEEKPYAPGFQTRLDFEVAHFAQENMLNKKATNELISLIRRCAANPEEFTIANHADMNRQWDQASKKCTEVRFRLLNQGQYFTHYSFKSMTSQCRTKGSTKYLRCMLDHYGIGPWI